MPILVFLGLSVLHLDPMYATDRQTDRQTSDAHQRLMPPLWRGGHNKRIFRRRQSFLQGSTFFLFLSERPVCETYRRVLETIKYRGRHGPHGGDEFSTLEFSIFVKFSAAIDKARHAKLHYLYQNFVCHNFRP